jgi:hypothetical protein
MQGESDRTIPQFAHTPPDASDSHLRAGCIEWGHPPERRTSMKHSLIALGCALALAGGPALAQQDAGKTSTTRDSSGNGGFVEKTKEAFHKLGESVKSGFHKAENKADDAKADPTDTRAMGAAGAGDADRQQRMDDADGNYKSGKAGATSTPSK